MLMYHYNIMKSFFSRNTNDERVLVSNLKYNKAFIWYEKTLPFLILIWFYTDFYHLDTMMKFVYFVIFIVLGMQYFKTKCYIYSRINIDKNLNDTILQINGGKTYFITRSMYKIAYNLSYWRKPVSSLMISLGIIPKCVEYVSDVDPAKSVIKLYLGHTKYNYFLEDIERIKYSFSRISLTNLLGQVEYDNVSNYSKYVMSDEFLPSYRRRDAINHISYFDDEQLKIIIYIFLIIIVFKNFW